MESFLESVLAGIDVLEKEFVTCSRFHAQSKNGLQQIDVTEPRWSSFANGTFNYIRLFANGLHRASLGDDNPGYMKG